MKRIVFALFVITTALGINAQYVTTRPTSVKTDVHPQLVDLVHRMNAAPTYGGTFTQVSVNGRKRAMRISSTDNIGIEADALDPTARFDFRPSEIELNERNWDQYVIPASVSFNNVHPANLVKRVDVAVNGVPRGHLGFEVEGVNIDNKVEFDIPLLNSDVGTVRLSAKITPNDGSTPETAEWDYTVPSCRVAKIIVFPNPPHGYDYAKHQGKVHGLVRNLMPGSAMLLWAHERWADVLANLDPTKPRSEWSGIIHVSSKPVDIDAQGNIRVTERYWNGFKGVYRIIIPSACGEYAMSSVERFYTDEAPKARTLGMKIEMVEPIETNLSVSRVTIENAPAGGWITSWAQGRREDGWWSYSPANYPSIVEPKEGKQERNFQYLLLRTFNYTVYAYYFGMTKEGYLELMLETSINNVQGSYPIDW